MKILYIHGLSSSGQSRTAATLRELLPHDEIFSPDLPIDPFEAFLLLRQLVEREEVDIIISFLLNPSTCTHHVQKLFDRAVALCIWN